MDLGLTVPSQPEGAAPADLHQLLLPVAGHGRVPVYMRRDAVARYWAAGTGGEVGVVQPLHLQLCQPATLLQLVVR